MRIAGVLCIGAAVILTALTVSAVARRPADPVRLVSRATAPTRLAAAAMFAVGGAVALAGPPHGAAAIPAVCVVGATGTVAAGSWLGARYLSRYMLRRELHSRPAGGCGGNCTCAQSPGQSAVVLSWPTVPARGVEQ